MNCIEWLEQMAKSMVVNGGDLGEDYPALMIHIQQAKQIYKQEQEKLVDEAITNYEIGWADRKKQVGFISDEEIEKGAEWLDNPIERLSWKEGAKWHREQTNK